MYIPGNYHVYIKKKIIVVYTSGWYMSGIRQAYVKTRLVDHINYIFYIWRLYSFHMLTIYVSYADSESVFFIRRLGTFHMPLYTFHILYFSYVDVLYFSYVYNMPTQFFSYADTILFIRQLYWVYSPLQVGSNSIACGIRCSLLVIRTVFGTMESNGVRKLQ